jgi:DNA polymerase-3 subunit delta'
VRCEAPLGHAATIAGLWKAARADRLAHALCFVGSAGIGKFLAAEWLALGLLCERGPVRGRGREIAPEAPCGSCGACKRARADSHPDVFVLDVECENAERPQSELEEQIRVHRIARRSDDGEPALADFLSLRAAEGGWRIVLVREAERANEEAQNALLKTLEEPGERVLIVLETARLDLLLQTTLSRCVRVAFGPLAPADARAVLEQCGIAGAQAEQLARWARGSPGRALRLARENAARQLELACAVAGGELLPAAALAELAELAGEFPGETPAALLRARARSFLDLVLELLLDAERAAAGLDPSALAHGARATALAALPAAARERRLAEVLAARQDGERNLAGDALLERALLALRGPQRARMPTR